MQISLDALQVGLRVLNAITYGCDADPIDILQLEAYAPTAAHLPPDDLACEVIQLALNGREPARA
jgi:hypothetical protein